MSCTGGRALSFINAVNDTLSTCERARGTRQAAASSTPSHYRGTVTHLLIDAGMLANLDYTSSGQCLLCLWVLGLGLMITCWRTRSYASTTIAMKIFRRSRVVIRVHSTKNAGPSMRFERSSSSTLKSPSTWQEEVHDYGKNGWFLICRFLALKKIKFWVPGFRVCDSNALAPRP